MALIAPVENGELQQATTSTKTEASGNDLGYDQFLQLLCAEMRYQDPLEPTSNTEYVAQLATFSQMEASLNMQNSIDSSRVNDLVGKYVVVKSTSSTTGETTAVAGFVDYVQYENNQKFISINGALYSADDVYEVADTDYMEAVSLAAAFEATLAKLPSKEKLLLSDETALNQLQAVYESLTAYQKSYIDNDSLTKFNELLAQMEILKGNTSENSGTNDNVTQDTGASEETGSNVSQDTGTTEGTDADSSVEATE